MTTTNTAAYHAAILDLEPADRYVIAETLLLVLAEGVTQEHFDQAMRRTQAMAGAS